MNKTKTRLLTWLAALLVTMMTMGVQAQQQSLAQSMDIHVFPKEGQNAEQQSMDEAECYTGAVDASGTDPFDLARQADETAAYYQQAQAQASQAGKGSAGGAAAGGAVAGAVVGGVVSGKPGRGAAIGAATGGIIGSRKGKKQQAQAEAEVAQQAAQAQQATEAQMANFKNAFAACVEAKEYIARF